MTYLALNEVGSAEAQNVAVATYFIFMLEFCKNICGFNSIIC